jgi:hypothetical protein
LPNELFGGVPHVLDLPPSFNEDWQYFGLLVLGQRSFLDPDIGREVD